MQATIKGLHAFNIVQRLNLRAAIGALKAKAPSDQATVIFDGGKCAIIGVERFHVRNFFSQIISIIRINGFFYLE